jgi:hypothetical protein
VNIRKQTPEQKPLYEWLKRHKAHHLSATDLAGGVLHGCLVNATTFYVAFWDTGEWDVYLPIESLKIDKTLEALSEACGVIEPAADNRAKLLAALRHIAFEPLTNDSEATDLQCLAEAVRIAKAVIAKVEEKS